MTIADDKDAHVPFSQLRRKLIVGSAGDRIGKKGYILDFSPSACVEPISKSPEEDDEAGELNKPEKILGMILPLISGDL